MHVLVVADGDVPDHARLDAAWPAWDTGISLVVAADGGAGHAERIGRRPDLVIGDGDSLDPGDAARFRAAGVEVRLVPADKDESDTELALLAALERGADRITVLGAFGGPRLDHALANVALLGHPELVGVRVVLLDGRSRVRLLTAPGRLELGGRLGDLVTLLPFGTDAHGVTTQGLRYPLADDVLRAGPARGLSNVLIEHPASVTLRAGRLLVVETAGTLPG